MYKLLDSIDTHPVLVDVGASGDPPSVWNPIASQSIYVGFDPDLREIREIANGRYFRSMMVNLALGVDPLIDQVQFNLTRSPYCSSTLMPDHTALNDYLFSDYFAVERAVTAKSSTLNSVLDQLQLTGVDWLKVDTQGTDLRLFTSLNQARRSSVLALDIEPGLIDAYVGEDSFVETHKYLTENGFWLANLNLGCTPRGRITSLVAAGFSGQNDHSLILRGHKPSPAWCESRYFRSPEWLAEHGGSRREFGLLGLFALMDNQAAFALDVAFEYIAQFGEDNVSRQLKETAITLIRSTLRRQQVLEKIRETFRPIRNWLRRHN